MQVLILRVHLLFVVIPHIIYFLPLSLLCLIVKKKNELGGRAHGIIPPLTLIKG